MSTKKPGPSKGGPVLAAQPIPLVSMDFYASGEEPYLDASTVPGYFPVFTRKQPDGTYDVQTGMFWDRSVTYSQMSVGSELVINTHKALSAERDLFGDGLVKLHQEFSTIMKAGQSGPQIIQFDGISRNAAGNLARAKRLAESMVNDLIDPAFGIFKSSGVNHVFDLDVGSFESWFNQLRIRWHTLLRGSFATAGFVLAPIGGQVGKLLPSTRIEYPFGGTSTKKVAWNFADDNLTLDDKKGVKDMVLGFFFAMGALGQPDAPTEDWCEHWSIKYSMLLEKFLRLGLSANVEDLAKALQLSMPYVLRPTFHDLPTMLARGRFITFLAGLLLACDACRADGVNTFIGPSLFRATPSKEAIPENLIPDCFNGDIRMDNTVSASSMTIIRPAHGTVSALRLMRGRHIAAVNMLESHTWLRPADIDWSPHIMTSEVLGLPSAPAWHQYKALGFGVRGQVLHMWADVQSKSADVIRIIDGERPIRMQGTVSADLNSITSVLLMGSTPIWSANTGKFITQMNIGTYPSGLAFNTRVVSTAPSIPEVESQNAAYQSGNMSRSAHGE